jgi:predicted ATPase
VLVECFYAKHGSTIIMEQPEIHLHPSVQAALADLFVEAVHAWEDGHARNIQLLIESHSEHFLRRLQRRIAEEAIDRDSVAIYVCRSTSSGSVIDPLDVDLYGNITNWPDSFFGDEVEDLRAMTEAAARRQSAGQHP